MDNVQIVKKIIILRTEHVYLIKNLPIIVPNMDISMQLNHGCKIGQRAAEKYVNVVMKGIT